MKKCHKRQAEFVKSWSTVEHLDFVSLRHLWRVGGPSGHLLGWHHQGHRPSLGQVSAPTCQLHTPVKSTKPWIEPKSTHAALSTMQLGIRHIRVNKNTEKRVIWTLYFIWAFLPGTAKKKLGVTLCLTRFLSTFLSPTLYSGLLSVWIASVHHVNPRKAEQ